MPEHGHDCSRFVHDLKAWNDDKVSELNALQGSVRREANTSKHVIEDMHSRFTAYEHSFQARVLAAEQATRTCQEANSRLNRQIVGLESSIDEINMQLEDLRRHHSAWRNWEVNFLSVNMGATVIAKHTSPTAKYGNGIIGRIAQQIFAPRAGLPAVSALSPWQEAGQCWCAAGKEATLGVELSQPAHPTAFSIEHVPRQGKLDMSSKPFEFELWVRVSSDTVPRNRRDDCISPPPGYRNWACVLKAAFGQVGGKEAHVQRYNVGTGADDDYAIDQVVVAVTSNYGNPDRTCLYRVKLAGEAMFKVDE